MDRRPTFQERRGFLNEIIIAAGAGLVTGATAVPAIQEVLRQNHERVIFNKGPVLVGNGAAGSAFSHFDDPRKLFIRVIGDKQFIGGQNPYASNEQASYFFSQPYNENEGIGRFVDLWYSNIRLSPDGTVLALATIQPYRSSNIPYGLHVSPQDFIDVVPRNLVLLVADGKGNVCTYPQGFNLPEGSNWCLDTDGKTVVASLAEQVDELTNYPYISIKTILPPSFDNAGSGNTVNTYNFYPRRNLGDTKEFQLVVGQKNGRSIDNTELSINRNKQSLHVAVAAEGKVVVSGIKLGYPELSARDTLPAIALLDLASGKRNPENFPKNYPFNIAGTLVTTFDILKNFDWFVTLPDDQKLQIACNARMYISGVDRSSITNEKGILSIRMDYYDKEKKQETFMMKEIEI